MEKGHFITLLGSTFRRFDIPGVCTSVEVKSRCADESIR